MQQYRWIGLVLMATGLVLAVVGLYRGEAAAVFDKAASLCLQCIGIG